jgi:hypothetical protein
MPDLLSKPSQIIKQKLSLRGEFYAPKACPAFFSGACPAFFSGACPGKRQTGTISVNSNPGTLDGDRHARCCSLARTIFIGLSSIYFLP